jgi:hypothetical protein
MKHILARQPVADSCQKIFPLRQEKIWFKIKDKPGYGMLSVLMKKSETEVKKY